MSSSKAIRKHRLDCQGSKLSIPAQWERHVCAEVADLLLQRRKTQVAYTSTWPTANQVRQAYLIYYPQF